MKDLSWEQVVQEELLQIDTEILIQKVDIVPPTLRGVDNEAGGVAPNTEGDDDIFSGINTGRKLNPFKYANVAYNMMKSREPVDTYDPLKPSYQKYQTIDTRPEDRRAALEAQKIRQNNIESTGGSRGQIQSYLGQSSARYSDAIADSNRRYAEQAQGVANQNVGLENQARSAEYRDQLGARDYRQRGEAARQDFQSEAPREIAQIAQLGEQASYMRQRNENQYAMNRLRARYLGTNQYVLDPATGELVHKSNR